MRPYRTPSPFALQDPPGAELQGAAAAIAGLHRQHDLDQARAVLVEVLLDLSPSSPPGTDRFFNDDLGCRSPADLRRERARLRLGILLHPRPPAFWSERLRALDEHLRRTDERSVHR